MVGEVCRARLGGGRGEGGVPYPEEVGMVGIL